MSTQKRDLLRKGNSELASLGIFVWSIPALVVRNNIDFFRKLIIINSDNPDCHKTPQF